MPELPEVETIRRDLSRVLRGRSISRVELRKDTMVDGPAGLFASRLKSGEIRDIDRRGKLLIFHFANDDDLHLLIHLKMTGQLVYEHADKLLGGGHGFPIVNKLPNDYSHIIFSFHGGGRLFFNDARQFGFARLVDTETLERTLAGFGVEPLSAVFTPEVLQNIRRRRQASLKSVLLNQQLIAGLGNIYVDEVCFAAGVRPMRRAGKVTAAECQRLHRAIVDVLTAALAARGTTFGNYRDGLGGEGKFVRQLKVYGRGGQECKQCGRRLQKVVVSQRGTVYCPVCQK